MKAVALLLIMMMVRGSHTSFVHKCIFVTGALVIVHTDKKNYRSSHSLHIYEI